MRALITGVTGQDGSYLADLLLEKGYEVYGVVRSVARAQRQGMGAFAGINYVEADLTDQTSLDRAMEVTGMGALRMLEAIRRHAPQARFLQASSSEIFGRPDGTQQSEATRLHPRNPYGAAKMFAHHITINYRESYGMFACACIAFNHESPRRALEFVTRKVSREVARIKLGLATKLKMG